MKSNKIKQARLVNSFLLMAKTNLKKTLCKRRLRVLVARLIKSKWVRIRVQKVADLALLVTEIRSY